MFASFRSRLVLSNLLITLIGLMLVVAVSTYVLAKRNQESNKNRLAHESRSVATEIDRLFADHGGSIWPTVHTAANILGEHIVVVGLHKTIVADSEESVPRVRASCSTWIHKRWPPSGRPSHACKTPTTLSSRVPFMGRATEASWARCSW